MEKNRFNWTVGKKLAALATVGTLTTTGMFAGAFWCVNEIKTETQVTQETGELSLAIIELNEAFADANFETSAAMNVHKSFADIPQVGAALDEVDAKAEVLHNINLDNVDTEVAKGVKETLPLVEAHVDGFHDWVSADGNRASTEAYKAGIDAAHAISVSLDEVYAKAVKSEVEHTDKVHDAIAGAKRITFILLILAWIGLAIASKMIATSITRPIGRLVAGLKRIGDGDLTAKVEEASFGELLELERSINETATNVAEVVQVAAGIAENVAREAETLRAETAATGQAGNRINDRVSSIATAVEQMSSNIQTVAAGSEQMSASIREIAMSASRASQIASEGVAVVEASEESVNQLGESSRQIGNVLKVIDSIAEQTNLLALNATIEAARAGEAGKGFGVVASEVKELAQETGDATEDISKRVEAIQSGTTAAVEGNARTAQIISEINDSQTTIASAVEEQTSTTNEMSRNVQDAASAVDEIATTMREVAGDTETTGAALAGMGQSIDQLASISESLLDVIGKFKRE